MGTAFTGYGYGFDIIKRHKNVAFFHPHKGSERVPDSSNGTNGFERLFLVSIVDPHEKHKKQSLNSSLGIPGLVSPPKK